MKRTKQNDYASYAPDLNTKKSWEYYQEAAQVLPGGAGSHARCYPTFDPYPLVIDRGKGSHIWDIDGNEYVDFMCSFGPLIHGHCHPRMVEAVKRQLDKGSMLGFANELELKVANKIRQMVPDVDKIRFSNSGVEAVMHAIRIARGFTGKDKIIKFEGGYHGALDYVLLSTLGVPPSGPRTAPDPVPASWGIPKDVINTMIVLPWNDLGILEKTIKRRGHEIAGVLTEPIQMNYGTVLPEDGYLKGMQEVCKANDIVFILDEIISGFRLAPGGAQEYYDIRADLLTLAKGLGGGYPISAIAGRDEIFEDVMPGKIDQAGTYNANPLCLAAADTSLSLLMENGYAAFKHMTKMGNGLTQVLQDAIDNTGFQAIVQGIGACGCQLYMTPLKKINEYRDFQSCDTYKYNNFHKLLVKNGVFTHPSQMEHMFVSTAHTQDDIEMARTAATKALKTLRP